MGLNDKSDNDERCHHGSHGAVCAFGSVLDGWCTVDEEEIESQLRHVLRSYVRNCGTGLVLEPSALFRPASWDKTCLLGGNIMAFCDDRANGFDFDAHDDCPIMPDIVVNILRSHEKWCTVEEKTNTWLQAGAKSVWLVYPPSRRIDVYNCDDSVRQFREDESLSLPELFPGLEFQVGACLPLINVLFGLTESEALAAAEELRARVPNAEFGVALIPPSQPNGPLGYRIAATAAARRRLLPHVNAVFDSVRPLPPLVEKQELALVPYLQEMFKTGDFERSRERKSAMHYLCLQLMFETAVTFLRRPLHDGRLDFWQDGFYPAAVTRTGPFALTMTGTCSCGRVSDVSCYGGPFAAHMSLDPSGQRLAGLDLRFADAETMTDQGVITSKAADVTIDSIGAYRVIVQKGFGPLANHKRWAFQIWKLASGAALEQHAVPWDAPAGYDSRKTAVEPSLTVDRSHGTC
jgi:hypothetical protein